MAARQPILEFVVGSKMDLSDASACRSDMLERLLQPPTDTTAFLDIAPGPPSVPSMQLLLAMARSLTLSGRPYILGPAAEIILAMTSKRRE